VSTEIRVIQPADVLPSLARVNQPTEPALRVALVQHHWSAATGALVEWLDAAVDAAAAAGARIVFLPEITLSRYPADTVPTGNASDAAEDLLTGPTVAFARRAAERTGVYVHASLYRTAAGDAEEARQTWAAVANAAARFESVSVVVHPRDVDIAPRYLDGALELHVREIDDAWIRDSGPTFVIDDDELAAVTWVFNGWGGQEWASWENDRTLGPELAESTPSS
jgi:hypothetical protein